MKQELRNYFRKIRSELSDDERSGLSKLAEDVFLSSELYKNAENIMVYMPLKSEADTRGIIAQALADGKTLLLPVTDSETGRMTAHVYTKETPTKTGAFSITEPDSSELFPKDKIDLVLVPGVAFSRRGARLGFGKGCYDRFLCDIKATKVGFCLSVSLSNRIKSEAHDVDMDYVVTEKCIYNCHDIKKHMRANYHTHTYFCHHAIDTPREYVRKAVEEGLEILGFSDHNPCPFSNGHLSNYRMNLCDTKAYISEINALKEEYKYQIEILLGYETEYYPHEYEITIDYIRKHGCDYMIMGQHFTKNEYDGVYSGSLTYDADILKQYIDQVIEGIGKGVFSYIAHPDLINYRGDDDIYQAEIKRLLCEAKRLGIPLEFNLLGFEECRSYPHDPFWRLVAESGCDVVIGCDAHEERTCANFGIYENALEKLKSFGITPIDYVNIKKV